MYRSAKIVWTKKPISVYSFSLPQEGSEQLAEKYAIRNGNWLRLNIGVRASSSKCGDHCRNGGIILGMSESYPEIMYSWLVNAWNLGWGLTSGQEKWMVSELFNRIIRWRLFKSLLDCNALVMFTLAGVGTSKFHGIISFSSYDPLIESLEPHDLFVSLK